jgi:hypothetical protein
MGHPDLSSLGGNANSGSNTHHCHRCFAGGGDNFDGSGAARFTYRASGKKSSPPNGGKIAHGRGCQFVGQSTHGAPLNIQKTGLPRQCFATLANPHYIERVGSVTGGLHHCGVGGHAKNVSYFTANPFGGLKVIEFNLNGNVAGNDVESAGEAKNRGQLSNSLRQLVTARENQFVFDGSRQ